MNENCSTKFQISLFWALIEPDFLQFLVFTKIYIWALIFLDQADFSEIFEIFSRVFVTDICHQQLTIKSASYQHQISIKLASGWKFLSKLTLN